MDLQRINLSSVLQ